jgi:hypothetical protein
MYISPQVRGLIARQNGGNTTTTSDTNSQGSDRNIIFVIVSVRPCIHVALILVLG